MDFFSPYNDIERVYSTTYDKCIIGYCQNTLKPIYSANKLIKVLRKEEYLEHYDAIDFITNHMRHDDAIVCIDYE